MNYKPSMISLFSGAGCFDIGFKAAGFRVVASVDIDKDSCKTLQLNNSKNVFCTAIEELQSNQLLRKVGARKKGIDLIVGGPPCQPYSKCSYGALGTPLGFDDHRASTLNHFMRVVREILPKAFIIENVPHFISGKNEAVGNYLNRAITYINRKHKTNYRLNVITLNAANYGIPQIRERVFIIASRDGKSFSKPEIQFHSTPDRELEIEYYRTVWDAIGHLSCSNGKFRKSTVGGRWGDLLTSIPPGKNYLWHTERGEGENVFRWRSRYWNFLLKLHPNLPSWTIPAQPGQFIGPFHWENRRLTLKEAALIQTVPEDYNFYGSESSIRKQIGNGVPAAIGELLGKELRKQFFGERIRSNSLTLIPGRRRKTKKFFETIPKRHHIDII